MSWCSMPSGKALNLGVVGMAGDTGTHQDRVDTDPQGTENVRFQLIADHDGILAGCVVAGQCTQE